MYIEKGGRLLLPKKQTSLLKNSLNNNKNKKYTQPPSSFRYVYTQHSDQLIATFRSIIYSDDPFNTSQDDRPFYTTLPILCVSNICVDTLVAYLQGEKEKGSFVAS